MKAHVLLLVWGGLLGTYAVGCGTGNGTVDEGPRPTVSASSTAGLPEGLSVARFTSVEDAERAGGFDIVTSNSFNLVRGLVYLQPKPVDPGPPWSTASLIYQVGVNGLVYLDVVPPDVWPTGPPGGGDVATLGGRDGLLLSSGESSLEFAFKCGHVAQGDFWCAILANDITLNELQAFVQSLS